MAITKTVTSDNAQVTINIDGEFNFNVAQEFRDSYKGINNSNVQIVIDFRKIGYVDSSGLGMLMYMQKQFNSYTNEIKLINCNPMLKKLFSMSNFQTKFLIE